MFQRLVFCGMAALLLTTADAQQLRTPQPSPTQMIRQDFGLSNIELTYSRPQRKERKVFGNLVPFGKMWRTGANAATKIKFGEDVKVGGVPVKAGEYALYTIPGENEWEIILNKGITNWGIDGYKPEDDVARIKVKPMKMNENMESFTLQFANVRPNSTELHIMWDNVAVAVPITVDIDSKIMGQIDNAMNKDNRPYYAAAMYYMETGRDVNQAIAWFDKAVEMNPNAYWVQHQRAKALAKAGRKADARAAAEKSMEMARKANNMDYVKLNEELLKSL